MIARRPQYVLLSVSLRRVRRVYVLQGFCGVRCLLRVLMASWFLSGLVLLNGPLLPQARSGVAGRAVLGGGGGMLHAHSNLYPPDSVWPSCVYLHLSYCKRLTANCADPDIVKVTIENEHCFSPVVWVVSGLGVVSGMG